MLNGTNALEDIQKSLGPSAKELAAMSHWLQCVHKRAEVLCSCSVEIEEGSMHKRKTLVGAEAMAERYEKCCQLSAGSHDANDLKEFRAFRWMLTEAQSKQIDAWERACVHTTKEKLALGKQKALKDLEKEAAKKKARHADEKKSMIVVAPKLKAVCGMKSSVPELFEDEKEVEAEEQEVCASLETGMLSFFGSRAL